MCVCVFYCCSAFLVLVILAVMMLTGTTSFPGSGAYPWQSLGHDVQHGVCMGMDIRGCHSSRLAPASRARGHQRSHDTSPCWRHLSYAAQVRPSSGGLLLSKGRCFLLQLLMCSCLCRACYFVDLSDWGMI